MKRTLLVSLMSLFLLNSFAQFVSIEKAKTAAISLYNDRIAENQKSISENEIISDSLVYYNETPMFYIFNFNNKGGFVITSSDERIKPVLGYSPQGNFNNNDMPDCLEWLFKEYKKQIYDVISNNLDSKSPDIKNEWTEFETDNISTSSKDMMSVTPLTTTTWSQGCYYNALCPPDAAGACGHTYTGCVGTAFAQVLKYYNYPATGKGSKSYYSYTYGTISANFAATTYDWAAMPNKLFSNNQAAATLLFHAGVSIEMNYGSDGSSAYATDVKKALINSFKYANTAQYINKTASYPQTKWDSIVRCELDAHRVVFMTGYDPDADAGHGFVCDGYQSANYFHINWGWNGSCDGYFYLNALSPSGYSFNTNVGMIVGIKPATNISCCSGTATLTASGGTFSDGSGANSYSPSLKCKWLIKPTDAGSVTLSFTAFQTESSYDVIKIYNGVSESAPLLATYSGNSIPASVTANSGKMFVTFTTNATNQLAGWTASYTSTPIANYCTGTKNLTNPSGNVTDGSGSKNYGNNSDCYWLIAPNGAQSVKLTFSSFNTESSNDILYVYNGSTTNSPLLGSYSGTSKPPALTASSGKMLLRFVSNASVTAAGWAAKYTSQVAFCSGTTILTNNSGTFSDGSGSKYYNNNVDCKWLIKPANASSITISFTAFNTESGVDVVKIYKGENSSAPLMATYSGSNIPSALTVNYGKVFVNFTTNSSVTKPGWTLQYTSTSKGINSIENNTFSEDDIEIMPNPNKGEFIVKLPETHAEITLYMTDLLGNIIYKNSIPDFINQTDIVLSEKFANGLYFIILEQKGRKVCKRVIINSNY